MTRDLRNTGIGTRRSLAATLAVLGVLGALVLGVGAWQVAEARDRMRQQVLLRNREAALLAAAAVGEELRGNLRLLDGIARRPGLIEAMAAGDRVLGEEHLRDLRRVNPDFASAALLDAGGTLWARDPADPAVIGRDFSFREYFRGALATRRPFLSGVFRQQGWPRAVVVAFSAPVLGPSGQVLGVVQATLPVANLQASDVVRQVPQGSLQVFDHAGHPVAGPLAGAERTLRSSRPVAEALAGRPGVGEAPVPGLAGRRLVAWAPVPAVGWAVLVEREPQAAYGPVTGLTIRLALLGCLVAAFTLAGVALAVRQLLRSFAAERRRASELEAANRSLEGREAELEALRAIDLSILGVAPFESTLAIARESLARLVEADEVGLILREPDGRTRRFRVGVGEAAEVLEGEVPDPGPLAEALASAQPVGGRVDPEGSLWEAGLASAGMGSYVVVPLVAGEDVLGALTVASRRGEPHSDEQVGTLRRVAGQLAVALRSWSLVATERRQAAHLEAIRQVGEAVSSSLDLDRVLAEALGHTLEVTGRESGAVWFLAGEELVLAASRNVPEPRRGALSRLTVAGSVIGTVVEDGRARVVADVAADPRFGLREELTAAGRATGGEGEGAASMVAAPLVWEGEVLGVLMVGSLEGPPPGEDDLVLLEAVARPVAAAIANARLHAHLKEVDASRQLLLSRLVSAQEEERRRIASDVHDDSVQVMTAAYMRLQMLASKVSEPEELEGLRRLESTLQGAISRLRTLLFELRPPALEREGLVPALKAYLHQAFADLPIRCRVTGQLEAEPPVEVRTILYRIAQEALTNVRKHARACTVEVSVRRAGRGVEVRVRDDGVGFVPEPVVDPQPGHLGLTNMHERSEIAGGWCRVDSAPGRGTTVVAWVPLPEAETSAA